MATFEGTSQEFHLFLGPRIKNIVNSMTRKVRLALNGRCEHCGNKACLHSAHVHGKERRTIVELVLENHTIDGHVKCNIEKFEQLLIQAHQPINNTFKFLCDVCHREYDKQNKRIIKSSISHQHKMKSENNEFKKLYKIKNWSFKPNQINHKIIRAFLTLKKNGNVSREEIKELCSDENNLPQYFVKFFDNNYNSMKTDSGNSHGKVFYEEDGSVHIHPEPEHIILQYFN